MIHELVQADAYVAATGCDSNAVVLVSYRQLSPTSCRINSVYIVTTIHAIIKLFGIHTGVLCIGYPATPNSAHGDGLLRWKSNKTNPSSCQCLIDTTPYFSMVHHSTDSYCVWPSCVHLLSSVFGSECADTMASPSRHNIDLFKTDACAHCYLPVYCGTCFARNLLQMRR